MAIRSRRSSNKRNFRNEGRLPRNTAPISVNITHIGGRGDGVGKVHFTHNYENAQYSVFVPACIPGETVVVQPLSISKQGIKGRILELKSAAHSRQPPQCNAFPACGGCSFQHWTPNEISKWKQQLIAQHLERANINAGIIHPAMISPAKSRRRASFHIKRCADSAVVGFHERMGNHIVDPDGCTIIDPKLSSLKKALVEFAKDHLPTGAMIKAHANLLVAASNKSHTGLCVYLQNEAKHTPWTTEIQHALCAWAAEQHLARLSIDDYDSPLTIFAPSQPWVRFGTIDVTPPPGAFLQATEHGEFSLQQAVAQIMAGHTHVADLFAGCGTLSLPLIRQLSGLLAVESDSAALVALKEGVNASGQGSRLTTINRNLFDSPLLPNELTKITGVIINPPRSGALIQCQQLIRTNIATIAMVSCNPASFAKDAACLTSAGFTLDWIQPVDQFSYSNHVELVGAFTR